MGRQATARACARVRTSAVPLYRVNGTGIEYLELLCGMVGRRQGLEWLLGRRLMGRQATARACARVRTSAVPLYRVNGTGIEYLELL